MQRVTCVTWHDERFYFTHPTTETVRQLTEGAIDHWALDGDAYALSDDNGLKIDPDVNLDDPALRPPSLELTLHLVEA